jgi:hypothetical protein
MKKEPISHQKRMESKWENSTVKVHSKGETAKMRHGFYGRERGQE